MDGSYNVNLLGLSMIPSLLFGYHNIPNKVVVITLRLD